MDRVIIDITRANPQTERRIVETVLDRDEIPLSHDRPIVIGFDSQADHLGPVRNAIAYRSLGAWLADSAVAERVVEELRSIPDPVDQVRVYSFSSTVLSSVGKAGAGRDVKIVNLRTYARPLGYADEWPDQLMPLHEALAVLESALERLQAYRGNPTHKTNIRPMLQSLDSRFVKRAGSDSSRPGLVSALLTEAQNRGLVELAGQEPSVLVALARTESAEKVPSPGYGPGLLVEHETEADPEVPRPSRSAAFQAILRNSDFGIFAEVRHEFYRGIREAVRAEAEPITARRACRQAIASLQDEMAPVIVRPGTTDLPVEKYPWRKVEAFGIEALRRAHLLAPTEAEADSDLPWLVPGRLVTRDLPDDLTTRLDAQLVLQIIHECGDVTWDDRSHIAGAILLDRSPASVEAVEEMLSLLHAHDFVAYDPSSQTFQAR